MKLIFFLCMFVIKFSGVIRKNGRILERSVLQHKDYGDNIRGNEKTGK